MSTAFNRLASIGLALLAVAPAAVADNYPSRPVRIVVPDAAGGPTDFLGRSIGQKLSARIGQPVVIENRPGAASIVGAETVARAKADGYTLLLATMGALALNPAIYSKLPYDPAKDFAPVGLISVTSNVLSIRSSLPISSVADLVAYAKREPDKLTFASVGVRKFVPSGRGSCSSPVRGGPDAACALQGGSVQVKFRHPGRPCRHVVRPRGQYVPGFQGGRGQEKGPDGHRQDEIRAIS